MVVCVKNTYRSQFKITLEDSYLCKLLLNNEKQAHKSHAHFGAQNEGDNPSFLPRYRGNWWVYPAKRSTNFADSPFTNGEIELDESYFGARRVLGVRGRGAKRETAVFGMLKRGEKVYTQIVKRVSVAELMPIIQGKADPSAVIYTDGFKPYDGLVNYGYKKHYRVKHSANEFANRTNHINGIENFWGLCKVRLSKFREVHKHTFYLHIKECEFRFNHRNQNLFLTLLRNFRNKPLKLS